MSELFTRYIKISRKDANGVDNSNTLSSLSTISIPWSNGNSVSYNVISRTPYEDYFGYVVDYEPTSSIDFSDADDLKYELNAEMDTSVRVLGYFPTQTFPIPLSISSVTSDNLGFVKDGIYTINTLPQKNITVTVQGSMQFANSFPNLKLGIYKITPSNPNMPSPFGAIAEMFLGTNTSNQTVNMGATLNKGTVNPGDQIIIGIRREGGSPLNSNNPPMQFRFLPTTTITINSTNAVFTTSSIVLEPNLSYHFPNSGCDVMQNNVIKDRTNSHTQDIDYSTSQDKPVNIQPIRIYEAQNSTYPESYYTQLTNANLRYFGSINQSSDFNIFDPTATDQYPQLSLLQKPVPVNVGNYGQTPSVSSLDVNLYEFDYGESTSPEFLNGGQLKTGAILQVDSTSSVKPVDPSSNLKEFLIKTDGLPSASSPYFFKRLPMISQSVNDYYYILNGNNPRNTPISLYTYTKDSTGDVKSIYPLNTQVVDTTFGIPKQSNFIVPSNLKFGTSNFGVGYVFRFSNLFGYPAEVSGLKLFENRVIYYSSKTYTTGSGNGLGVSPSLLYNGTFDSILDSTGASSVGGINFYKATSSIVPIYEQLQQGERWFCSFYENLELPLDVNNLRPYKLNNSLLGSKGVAEIAGVYRELEGDNHAYYYVFKDTVTNLNIGDVRFVAGESTAPPVGMLMWKAESPNASEFVIVKDKIENTNNGAFTNAFAPNYLKDNIEKISQEFGSNKL